MSNEQGGNPNPEAPIREEIDALKSRIEEVDCKQAQNNESDEAYKKLQVKLNSRVVLLTFFLVIFGAIGNLIAIWQTSVAQDAADAALKAAETAKKALTSSDETSSSILEQMQAQSEAMQEAAKAAVDSNRITINANRDEQRAWVGPSGIMGQEPKAGVPFRYGIRVTNSGRTPASNVHPSSTWRMLPFNTPFSPLYNPRDTNLQASFATLFPNTDGGTALAPPITFTEPQIAAIRDGRAIFYVYGRITYNDVSKRPHETTWCLSVSRDLGRVAFCDVYNHAE